MKVSWSQDNKCSETGAKNLVAFWAQWGTEFSVSLVFINPLVFESQNVG